MACAVVLEVFRVIVHDIFCAVPSFSVQDIANSKSQFLHLPISVGGAMLQVSVYGLGRYVSVTPTYYKNFVLLGERFIELFSENFCRSPPL